MALSDRHQEEIFIEIFDLDNPGAAGVLRRDVTTWTDAQRDEYARGFAARIDSRFDRQGVRLARVLTETLKTY